MKQKTISKEQAKGFEKIYPYWQIKTDNGIILSEKHKVTKNKSTREIKISDEKSLMPELTRIENAHFIFVILEFGNNKHQAYDKYIYVIKQEEYEKIKSNLGNISENGTTGTNPEQSFLSVIKAMEIQMNNQITAKLNKIELDTERARIEAELKMQNSILQMTYESRLKELENTYKQREEIEKLRKQLEEERYQDELERLEEEREKIEESKNNTKEMILEGIKGIPSLLGLFSGLKGITKEKEKEESKTEEEPQQKYEFRKPKVKKAEPENNPIQ